MELKRYKVAPLPFHGQKRNFVEPFVSKLKELSQIQETKDNGTTLQTKWNNTFIKQHNRSKVNSWSSWEEVNGSADIHVDGNNYLYYFNDISNNIYIDAENGVTVKNSTFANVLYTGNNAVVSNISEANGNVFNNVRKI